METKKVEATDTAGRELAAERVFDAPRDIVWKAWTDPDQIAQWWGPKGFTTTTETMELKPDGTWRFVMHGPDGRDYRNKIIYIDIREPEYLEYRHAGEGDTESIHFHVTVNFVEEGNKTVVTMKMLFESAEELKRVDREYGAIEGLKQTMSRLKVFLANK